MLLGPGELAVTYVRQPIFVQSSEGSKAIPSVFSNSLCISYGRHTCGCPPKAKRFSMWPAVLVEPRNGNSPDQRHSGATMSNLGDNMGHQIAESATMTMSVE